MSHHKAAQRRRTITAQTQGSQPAPAARAVLAAGGTGGSAGSRAFFIARPESRFVKRWLCAFLLIAHASQLSLPERAWCRRFCLGLCGIGGFAQVGCVLLSCGMDRVVGGGVAEAARVRCPIVSVSRRADDFVGCVFCGSDPP